MPLTKVFDITFYWNALILSKREVFTCFALNFLQSYANLESFCLGIL